MERERSSTPAARTSASADGAVALTSAPDELSHILERLQAVSTAILCTGDVEALYERTLDAAIELMRADCATLQILDAARGELRLLGARGFAPEVARLWGWVRPDSQSTCGKALLTRSRVVVPSVAACDWIAGSDDGKAYLATGIEAVQTTPLLSRAGAVIGMLSTHWRRAHEPAPVSLQALDVLARLVANLAERAFAVEAERERAAWVRSARDALYAALDRAPLERSLGMLVQAAVDALGAEVRVAAFLADEEGTALRHVVGMGAEYGAAVDGLERGPESLACGPATHAGQPILTADVTVDERWAPWRWLAERFDYRGCWIFPLHGSAGRLVGAVVFYWRQPRAPAEREREVAAFVTDAASVILSQHRDAEARARAEDALRESEARERHVNELFNAVVEASPVMLFTQDRELRYTWFPQAVAGLRPTDVIGKTDHEVLERREDADGFVALKRRALETDEAVRGVIPALIHGATRWYDVHVRPQHGDGEVVGILVAAVDVTERWLAGKERERLQEEVRADLDAMTRLQRIGALYVQGNELGPVLSEIVEAAIAITGADFGDMQVLDAATSTLRMVVQRGFPSWWVDHWAGASQGRGGCGTALERRERVVVEDVERSPIFAGTPELELQLRAGVRALQSTPLLSRSGKPLGILSTHYRTPRRPDDRALRSLDLLARQASDIVERAQAEASLQATSARLAEVDRRKTEFLAVLSHELRNPLAPIRNSIHVLERAAPGSEPFERARKVLGRQTDHLARLVDDLLDVVRITRGRVELHRERVDLREIVRQAMDAARPTFAQADIELRMEHALGPTWLDADPTRIAQVVGNLLHNAQKFTPAGGTVTVSLESDAGKAYLRVKDTGVGMEPGREQEMFEAFAQGDQGLARAKGGLGLGLSLVKLFAELHGGAASATSEGRGRGTEFVVTLPLAATEAPQPSPGQLREAPACSVLVIEDNADGAQSLADVLSLDGHVVRVAHSGGEGVAMAREHRPDVILCDIGLPDVDGYEVARQVRAIPELEGVRLVAVTGYAQAEDRERAKDAGFDAHLAKPPDPAVLAHALGPEGRGESPG